jgi:hypothetical protein
MSPKTTLRNAFLTESHIFLRLHWALPNFEGENGRTALTSIMGGTAERA